MTTEFDDLKKCLHMMISLIPYYHTGKTSSKRFQLRISAHYKKLVKTNENKFIINKKFNPILGKTNLDEILADAKDCLSATTRGISKLIEVKFRKSPGDNSYSRFPHRGDFIAGSGFTGKIFTGELSGMGSVGALRRGITNVIRVECTCFKVYFKFKNYVSNAVNV